MFQILSMGVGVLIAVMISFNSQLAAGIGNIPASIIIHIVGLAAVSILILFKGNRFRRPGVPFFLRLGGIAGIGVTLFNNLCFLEIGASLTIGLGILGQTLAGQAVDLTGFLGMEKHPFKKGKLVGWVLILSGTLIMTGGERGRIPLLILALAAGALVMLSSVLNARLAKRIGILEATRNNFVMGLGGLLLLFFANQPSAGPFRNIGAIPPVFILGGGLLAVLVVMGLNSLLPRISAVSSTILIFSGQMSTGLFIDYLLTGQVSARKGLGALVILSGLGCKTIVDRRGSRKKQHMGQTV